MPAANYPITIEQGATYELPVTLEQPTSDLDPTPIPMDLTGFTALSQIRLEYADPVPLATFTIGFLPNMSTTGSQSSSGSLVLSLTREQTALLPPINTAVYDLVLFQGNTEIRIMEGTVNIKPGVSR